jgi:hypothetical protein
MLMRFSGWENLSVIPLTRLDWLPSHLGGSKEPHQLSLTAVNF